MNRVLAALLVGVMLISGCGEDLPVESDECVEGERLTTDSQLVYVEVRCGQGVEAEGGAALTVHYVGRLDNGTVFESTRGSAPFEFLLGAGQVIEGWDEGFDGMSVGGVRELQIPPHLAFGPGGAPPSIPSGSTLTFEVELMGVRTAD